MAIVLLADDDQTIRDLYRTFLVRSGHVVYEAEDGVAALTAVEKVKPDIVLLDLMMPRMHGLDVLKNLRAQTQSAQIPVVIISQISPDRLNNETCLDEAAGYFIKTETKLPELAAKVTELTSKSRKGY